MESQFGPIKIDEFNRNKINELRQAIGQDLLEESVIFNDDYSMLRWLLFHDYKIGKGWVRKKPKKSNLYD